VLVKGDAVGATLYYGAGAGAEPTASSVIADIVDIARQISQGGQPLVPSLAYNTVTDKPLVAIENITTAFYLRILAEDKPGVLSQITKILSDEGVSIEAMHQAEQEESEENAEIVVVTNRVKEHHLLSAVEKIKVLNEVKGRIQKIRVESLG
jgi:homoserine dehydrogenase